MHMNQSLKRRVLPPRRLPQTQREAGNSIRKKIGEGDAFAHICGSGSAIAVTERKSLGQATAICEGRGHSYALVDHNATGSACAVSNAAGCIITGLAKWRSCTKGPRTSH
jgi:hypothetical protein